MYLAIKINRPTSPTYPFQRSSTCSVMPWPPTNCTDSRHMRRTALYLYHCVLGVSMWKFNMVVKLSPLTTSLEFVSASPPKLTKFFSKQSTTGPPLFGSPLHGTPFAHVLANHHLLTQSLGRKWSTTGCTLAPNESNLETVGPLWKSNAAALTVNRQKTLPIYSHAQSPEH